MRGWLTELVHLQLQETCVMRLSASFSYITFESIYRGSLRPVFFASLDLIRRRRLRWRRGKLEKEQPTSTNGALRENPVLNL